ncbi:MAG: EAL domain-containing protein [Gammaproteobacteria bacterium]
MFSEVLRSRVGREIFALSSLIAAVPILVVGTLSLLQVNRTFAERGNEYLRDAAHAYGEVVYERLLLAAELIRHSATGPGIAAERPAAQLVSLEVSGREGPNDIARKTLRIVDSVTPAQVHILRRIGDDRTAIGHVSPDYLWGQPEDHPYSIEFCVLASGTDRPIYCSQALPEAQWARIRDSASVAGSIQWDSSGTRMNSAWWELFTNSVFDGPLLRFVATQPETVALGPWNAFKALYAPALLLAVGIVLIAAGIHVRRTLQPIRELLAATERISSGDFRARAEIARKDEFGNLARAMNAMAAGLSRQFETLRTLGRVDRLILGGAGIEQVVERVLRHVAADLPCRAVAVVLPGRESSRVAIAHVQVPGAGAPEACRLTLPADALEALQAHREGKSVSDPAGDAICRPLAAHGAARALVYPLRARERVAGVLAIGLDAGGSLDDSRLHAVRDFAGRLAVALEAVEREAELLRRAYFDELTRLPNRQLLLDRLEQALIQARHAGEPLLVVFVDLDRFKAVNDSFGHAAGDGLLREAATRLRTTAGQAMTVARLGGDEFVVLLPQPAGAADSTLATVERLLAEMSRPFRIGATEVFLSASIGIAAYPADGEAADELLRKADTAMYGAKEAGRGQALFHSADMSRRVRQRLDTESQLRHALEREEFRIAFQPQVCLRTDRIVAAEALLRWDHPGRGAVNPSEFIPIAEETGYITILGAWAMFQACSQFGRWHRAGGALEQVAVNVSVRQFRQAGFAAQVEECLSRTGVPPRALLLELTESIFVHDLASARRVIGQLKEIGVSIAIDDFGTGYSSLGYLKQLNFDQVKIDRAFIKELPDDRDGTAIVNAVVAMSHTLGKPVMAEGIDMQRQLAHLKKVGVDLGQGFLLGRPAFAADFPLRLAEGPATAPRLPSAG